MKVNFLEVVPYMWLKVGAAHLPSPLKAFRPLIRVLVINDNIYGLTISLENLYVRLVHENVYMSGSHEKNWR